MATDEPVAASEGGANEPSDDARPESDDRNDARAEDTPRAACWIDVPQDFALPVLAGAA